MNTEPVSITAAITAAIQATLAILLFVDVDPELVGALQVALIAWVGVIAVIVRSRVTPNENVALTVDEAKVLTAPEFPTTTNLEG